MYDEGYLALEIGFRHDKTYIYVNQLVHGFPAPEA
jgi:hypothetical protein